MGPLKQFIASPTIRILFYMVVILFLFFAIYEPICLWSGAEKTELQWHKDVDTLYYNIRDRLTK